MKKYLKFSGVVSIVLSIVLLVLLITSEFLIYTDLPFKDVFTGKQALFGGREGFNNAAVALVAWAFIASSLILLVVGFLAPMINLTGSANKVAAIFNFIAVALFIVAGILILFARDAFINANMTNASVKEFWPFLKSYGYSGVWIFLGILSIVTGLITVVPALGNILEKK